MTSSFICCALIRGIANKQFQATLGIMRIRLAIAFVGSLYAASVHAEGDPCGSLSLSPEVRQCQSELTQAEDTKLNAIYARVRAESQKKDPDFVKALEKSQKAWLSYRDAYCQAYVQSIQITPDSPWKDWWLEKCLAKVTARRAAELREDFQREPGK